MEHFILWKSLIGCSDLTRNATGHLGGQMKTGADIIIGSILQSNSIAHFAMVKRVLAYKVECVAICQLSSTQCVELFWRGIQFEFCRYHRFHTYYCIKYSTKCQGNEQR